MIGKLLAIEKVKTVNYTSFWIIMLLFTLLIILAYFIVGSFGNITVNGEQMELPQFRVYEFPMLWHYLTYISGFLHYIPALLIILLVTNDIEYGIWKQHVADGLGRGEIVGAKILVIALISFYATLVLLVMGLFYGISNTSNVTLALVLESAGFLIGYGIQIFAYLSLAFLFAIIARRPAQAVILLLVYGIILERLLRFFLPEELSFYLPMAAFSGIISNPFMSLLGVDVIDTPFITNFYISLVWIGIILSSIFSWHRYKDI